MKKPVAGPDELVAGVHPDIAHLSWLVGDWRGVGKGALPGADDFMFEQVVQFATDGRPFLEYRAVSWICDADGNRLAPSHTEQGYWRGTENNGVEVMIANPLGICEIMSGRVEVSGLVNARITGASLILHADAVAAAPTAARLHHADRMYGLRDGRLLMTFDMGLEGRPRESHVWISMEPA